MPVGVTTVVIAGLVGTLLGVGGTLWVSKDKTPAVNSAEVVAATAAPIEAAGDAGAKVAAEGLSVEKMRLEAQLEVARMPASRVLSEAVVATGCTPLIGATAVYAIAVSGSQGKEGSASVNAEEAQQDVSKVLAALVEDPALCAQAPEPAEPVAVEPTE